MRTSRIAQHNRKTNARFLDHFYRVPDPNETMGEFEQFFHIDLCRMPLETLRSEERRVQYRLDLDEKPPAWLWERLEAVRQEIARHHKSSTQEPLLPVQGLQQRIAGIPRYPDRGVPLAVRRIDVEGGHD